jgi:hypothetical protein
MSDLDYILLIGKKNEATNDVDFKWITKGNIESIKEQISELISETNWTNDPNFLSTLLIENDFGIYEITLCKEEDLLSRVHIYVAEEPENAISTLLDEFELYDTIKKKFLTKEDLIFDYFNE